MTEKTVKASLILENGVVFSGRAFGFMREAVGEVVFNTSMTGYEEILTDPSYSGQMVVMTYPLIGNYGINLDDMESQGPLLKAFIVREQCRFPNNFRCELDLDGFLKQNKIIGLEGIDTRALTKIIRDHGTMKGIVTTRGGDMTPSQIEQKFTSLNNKNVIRDATTSERYELKGEGKHIAYLDLGTKHNIMRSFAQRGCHITVFPAFSTAEEILSVSPDGIFISNGPGDPKDVPTIVEEIQKLLGKKPIVGVCMGHQLLSLALGGDTTKLKFGHHGGNHPVRDEKTGRVFITAQNHNYVVSHLPDGVLSTFTNVNDGTLEGMESKKLGVYSVQFHPEAAPGPLDTGFLFQRFMEIMEGGCEYAKR